MPPVLRKRKAPAPPPAPAPKKQPKTAKAATKVKEAVKEKPAKSEKPNGSSKPAKPVVGDTITLEGFGGEVETNDGTKTTLKSLLDESKSGVVLFVYPKASTPGCKHKPKSALICYMYMYIYTHIYIYRLISPLELLTQLTLQ